MGKGSRIHSLVCPGSSNTVWPPMCSTAEPLLPATWRRDPKLQLALHRFCPQRIDRAGQLSMDHVAQTMNNDSLATHVTVGGCPCGSLFQKIGKRSLSTSQVGYTHCRQLHPVKSIGRERDRYAQHRAEDARLTQDLPKRFAFTEALDLRS